MNRRPLLTVIYDLDQQQPVPVAVSPRYTSKGMLNPDYLRMLRHPKYAEFCINRFSAGQKNV